MSATYHVITRQTDIKRKALTCLLASAVALFGANGCKNTNFLSTKEEVRIGRDASKQIEHEYRVDGDTADARRVRRIGARLLLHSDKREGVPYTFKVLDINQVNAVSLPGGPIYVYRGLLDLVGEDDDGLASIIGHEMGHVNARHAAKQISQQMAANIGIAVLLKGQTAQNFAGMASDLLSLHYSRDDEYEADRRGLSYTYKAGFDPRGMIRFFKKLETMDKGSGGPEFLRTHPVTTSRIGKVEKLIQTQNYPYGQ